MHRGGTIDRAPGPWDGTSRGPARPTHDVSFPEGPPESAARREDLWAVVLAGGEGRRLQRFVRQVLRSERPKQFCCIVGTRSMLRHTWDRAARVLDADRIVTVITAGQERYMDEEARRGVPGTVLVQPENKGTAPGLLFPLLWIARRAPAACVVVFPADHFVWAEARFAAYVRSALVVAEFWPRHLVLLGVTAEGPETGYGWLAPGAQLAAGAFPELYPVRHCWEKPDQQVAARLFASGCLWNTLVLTGCLDAYLDLAEACAPGVLASLRAVAGCLGAPEEAAALAAAYRQIALTDLSRAILSQRPEGLLLLAARGVGWSDWGDPGRIVRTLRRFDRSPSWLPGFDGATVQMAAGA